MAYREQISTVGGDPNPSTEEMFRQAGEILARLSKGDQTATEIAADLGMCRQTFYNRVKMISGHLPSREALRLIHFERYEQLWADARERLAGGADAITNADYFRGMAVTQQLLARQSALFEDMPATDEPEDDTPAEDWEAGE